MMFSDRHEGEEATQSRRAGNRATKGRAWRLGLVCCFAWMCVGLASFALAGTWTVTTADFRKQSGELAGMTEKGITLKQDDGKVLEFAWGDVAVLRQQGVGPTTTDEPFVLYLRQGQRIAGQPLRLTGDQLVWRSGLGGEMSVAMESVKGFARAGVELPAAAGKEDVVQLTNKDELKGIVDASEGGISVQQGAGGSAPLTWDNIKAIVLADVGTSKTTPANYWVKAADGSIYSADSLESQADDLKLKRQGTTSSLPASGVMQIQNHVGKAVFLAWLQPAEFVYTPYVQFSDQKAAGMRILDEVRLGGRTYANAIELRPRSVLRYTAPADGMLHLQYATTKAGGLTDMTIKITAGGKTAHEVASFRSTKVSAPVDVPVNKGEAVTMEVGFGKGFDAQDYLMLLDAAFVAK